MDIREVETGVYFGIRVKPSSPAFRIAIDSEGVIMEIRSPPEDNRANKEIIQRLRRIFRRDVSIVSGLKSREKVIFVRGIKRDVVERGLGIEY